MLPAVDYLIVPDKGDPYLEGHKCDVCGAIFLGERTVCSKCFARDKISKVKFKFVWILLKIDDKIIFYRKFEFFMKKHEHAGKNRILERSDGGGS